MKHYNQSRLFLVIIGIFLSLIAPAFADAATITWNGTSGLWSNAAKWSPAQVPTSADDVVISTAGTYTVTLDINATVNSLVMNAATGQQALSVDYATLVINSASTIGSKGVMNLNSSIINGTGTLTNQGTLNLGYNNTVNAGIDNSGIINAYASNAINGALVTQATSTLHVEAVGCNYSTDLTVASGFTNNGVIELTQTNACDGRQAVLRVTNGILLNASGGRINIASGDNSGTRYLNAQVDNQGTIMVNYPFEISTLDAVYTNRGTINIAAGLTFTIGDSATLIHAAGGSIAGAGALSFYYSTLTLNSDFINAAGSITLSSATVNGAGTFINAAARTLNLESNNTINAGINNSGIINAYASNAINGALVTQATSTLHVEAVGCNYSTDLTVASGFTNNGVIELTQTNACDGRQAVLRVTNGTLLNASGGRINIASGDNSGTRYLNAQVDNQGTIMVNYPFEIGTLDAVYTNRGTINIAAGLTFTIGDSATLIHAAGGSIAGAGALSFYYSTLTLNSDFTNAVGSVSLSYGTMNGAGTFINPATRVFNLTSSTISNALNNSGTVNVYGTTALNGSFTAQSGSLLHLESSCNVGYTPLTVASGFTNNGTIELTNVNCGYSSTLIATNGTLVNGVGGSINSLVGDNGGSRTITAAINNQGTITVSYPLTIDKAAAAHTNSGTLNVNANLSLNQSGTSPSFTNTGTIMIASNKSMSVDNGTFTIASAGTITGAGALAMNYLTFTLNSDFTNAAGSVSLSYGTINGTGTFINPATGTLNLTSSTIATALNNGGTVNVYGDNRFNGTFTAQSGSLLHLESSCNVGYTPLTVASGFTNNGTIELTNVNCGYSSTLIVTNGTLVNGVGGSINSLVGDNGGGRTITAAINNQGTITVGYPLTIDRASAAHTNSGTLNVNANLSLNQSGTNPSFTNTGTITIAAGETMSVSGGTFSHTSGTLSGAALSLESLTAAFSTGVGVSALNLSNSTVTLAANLNLNATSLTAAASTINGAGLTITNPATKTLNLTSSTINTALNNSGTVNVYGTNAFNGTFTAQSGSLLHLESSCNVGYTPLTVASGFTNNGTIELTNVNCGYSSTLIVTSGTLVNGVGGSINSLVGDNGGSRTITAAFNNKGTINVNYPLTIDKAAAVHTNSGTINVNADLTYNQSGTSPSFANTGTITIASGKTMSLNNGTFAQNSGALSGAGTLSLNNLTTVTLNTALNLGTLSLNGSTATLKTGTVLAALNLTSAIITLNEDLNTGTTSLFADNSTINGAGLTITNPATKTLNLNSSTINTALNNGGTVNVTGGSAFNGLLTTLSGALLHLGSSCSSGGATLTVANGFTNYGKIELINSSCGYSPALTVTSGRLVNAAGGSISSLVGDNGGGRSLIADLDNQGTINVNYPLTIDKASAVHTNSGAIIVNADLTMTQTGLTNTGIITIHAGKILSMSGGTFANAASGTLQGNGTLNVSGTIFSNAGSINPKTAGLSGILAITGGLPATATSAITIDIGGPAVGAQYDKLAVSGEASLDGALNVTLIDGYTPNPGDTFTIMTYGSKTGAFVSTNLPVLPGGKVWALTVGSVSVTLGVSTDLSHPNVAETTPLNGAANVPLNSVVSAVFSAAMNSTTIKTTSFTVSGMTGSVAYNASTKTATFTPDANLAPNTTYTATLTTAVKDLTGNGLAAAYVWSFTTEATLPFRDDFSGSVSPNWLISNPDTDTYSLTENPGSLRIYTSDTDIGGGTNNLANLFAVPINPGSGTTSLTAKVSFPTPPYQNYQQGGIVLYADAAGQPDMDNYIRIGYYYDNSGGTYLQVVPEIGGVPAYTIVSALSVGANPVWLRLVKADTVYSAYYSLDGIVFTLFAGPDTYNLTVAHAGLFAGNGPGSAASIPVDFDYFEITDAPKVHAISPVVNAFGVAPSAVVTATFSEGMTPSTIKTATFLVSGTTGSVTYNSGSRTATFTPDSPLSADTMYTATLTNGMKDLAGKALQAYSWSFTTALTSTITATAGAHGSISPSGAAIVNCGTNQYYTITPNAGYHVEDVLVDGSSAGAVMFHAFMNVISSHTITASFAINSYSIVATAGANGSISSSGTTTVNYGASKSYTITPNPGYHVAAVVIDGAPGGAVTAYTFANIAADHTISVSFAADILRCADPGIPCLERTDGGSDGDNLVDNGSGVFKPKMDRVFRFLVTLTDPSGAWPQYTKVYIAHKSAPTAADFYAYPLTCSGAYDAGATCTFEAKLGPAAAHSFYFEAKLNDGTIVTCPGTGVIPGPQIQLLTGSSMIGVSRDVRTAALDGAGAFGTSAIYRWVSTGLTTTSNRGAYELVDSAHPQVQPGEGYVIKNPVTSTLQELATFSEIDGASYSITLKPGWNMISNPYNGAVRLNALQLKKNSGTPLSWLDAAGWNWVINAVYSGNGSDWGGTYFFESAGGNPEAELTPWLGYWIYLNIDDGVYTLEIPKP